MLSMIKTETTLTVYINGITYTFSPSSLEGVEVYKAITEKKTEEEILNIINKNDMKEYCKDFNIKDENLVITNDTILIDGEEISNSLANQIRRHYKEGLPVKPIVNFVIKLRKNPSYRIREQLWKFIEASQNCGGFTLSEDGDIIAYKRITKDYKDIYTKTIDNSIGKIVEMDRRNVNDDPNITCSSGLHFCAYSYLENYAHADDDRIVVVKVNPKDVVSIPTDYYFTKARCCRYEVIDEVTDKIKEPIYTKTVSSEETYFTEKIIKRDIDVLRKFMNEYYYDSKNPDVIERAKYHYKKDKENFLYNWIDFLIVDEESFMEFHTKKELHSYCEFISVKVSPRKNKEKTVKVLKDFCKNYTQIFVETTKNKWLENQVYGE